MNGASVLTWLAAASPSPTPSVPAADSVTPGPWGFIAIFGVALVVLALIWDMVRRVRRVRYRAEVAEKLDAEEQAARGGKAEQSGSDHRA
ncbi:hypothetical protein [Gryllotalpicola ginsengisoli]|uniref:hypothetical protein n=1 Tax=Gryllotalpicola ginsengisoli TaxID=444608 RepID=UPI0003B47495|nr:hypothetical protein [Gryllotalpicola ginsengisoli]